MICFETQAELATIMKRLGVKAETSEKLSERIWIEKEKIEQLAKLAKEKLSEEEKQYLFDWQASKVKKTRRKSGKKRLVIQLKHFGIVHELRQKGYSYQEIADYLAKYHKIKISQSLIQRYYLEQLENLKKTQEAQNEY